MTDQADQTIKVLRAGLDEFAALVNGFTEEDLARVSGASEWDVSQVLSHLGSGAEISLAALDRALSGEGTPQMDFIRGVWARWDGMSRAERAAEVVGVNEALVSRFEGLDEAARRDLRVELWFPVPAPDVAGFAGMRLSEFAYHTWDVKVAFDPAATLSPEATELMADGIASLIGFAGKADRLGGREAAVEVRTTAPERSFGLEIRDAVRIADVPGAPDAVLAAPAEWWLRLVSGRHAPEHTPDGVRLTGDALTLDDLRAVFPGF
ncbi:maleylpyruvate isomerase family mycothiol-dependent enzyme [Sphaerisporangium sp. NPDC051017]|uniref:maleylpyruvate isomerase family mycothiol-dependent enzyme n=1 Tax=Sphaerisporangium sp. NPDC051017 TaxID=3154636 RepID=UPI0034385A25